MSKENKNEQSKLCLTAGSKYILSLWSTPLPPPIHAHNNTNCRSITIYMDKLSADPTLIRLLGERAMYIFPIIHLYNSSLTAYTIFCAKKTFRFFFF